MGQGSETDRQMGGKATGPGIRKDSCNVPESTLASRADRNSWE